MAVRFLPAQPEGHQAPQARDREHLAEVIELRGRLQPAPETRGQLEPVDDYAHVRSATDDAVRILARKARSSGELRKELIEIGHDFADVEGVVLECESRLYLDDLGLARVLAETLRARKRASRSQIRLKLRERLLPDGVIETALGELDEEEEHELLREAASERARKMGGLDRQTAERRLLGFLARRGWSGERAVRVAREALDRRELRGQMRGAVPGRGASQSRSAVRFQ